MRIEVLQIHDDNDIAMRPGEFIDRSQSVDLEDVSRKKFEEMSVSEGSSRSIAGADKRGVEINSCITASEFN